MSVHTFDPEIAEKVGVNAAILYKNIYFWCQHNAANGKNIRDGKAWTYNSMAAFEKLFSYFSVSQIRTGLDKLEEAGLIVVGNFNKDPRDRTRWYAISGRLHLGKFANGVAEDRSPLPDSKPTDIKHTPISPQGGDDLFTEMEEPKAQETDWFEEFWKVYPKKVGKPAAKRAWAKAVKKSPPEKIIARARRYGEMADPQFTKNPQGWLNDERWNDDALRPASRPVMKATDYTPGGIVR